MMTTGIKTTIANLTLAAATVTTVACGAQTPAQQIAGANGVTAAPAALQQASAVPNNGQVMVNCGPGQQAMIRPVLMNGQAVSQVECVAVAAPGAPVYQPVAYGQPQPIASTAYAQPAYPQAAPQPTYVSYEPAAAPAPRAVRRASYKTSGDYVQYEPVRKPTRDWKKSAIVIGSTAGIGAGVGAAAGGKKGALIGAAIGGGGAAIWDQMTRRKE